MTRALMVLLALALVSPARGEPVAPADYAVALLPLDADRSLEIYGQPIANQIARALTAGAIPVVVVGAKMAVPERARLIVDGTIAAGKAGAITLAIRVRGLGGTVIDTLSASAPGLAKLDGAASELASRVLPIVRDQLAAIRARAGRAEPELADHGRVSQGAASPPEPSVRISISDDDHEPERAPLVSALEPAVASWLRAHHRQLERVEPSKLAARGDELAIALSVVGYTAERLFEDESPLPAGRARVRVKLSDARGVMFDRVVVTDTVLGERGMAPADLAARVAREVLDILRPHMRRLVRAWE